MSEWISVKDRLPEKSQEVIVFCRTPGLNDFVNTVYYSAKFQEFNWCDFMGDPPKSEKGYRDVTHWMPLPEPPEEKQHDD